jgi:WD40 repeat protein
LVFSKDLIHDAHRFVEFHQPTIEMYPLQLYASALLFSPAQSLTRKLFQNQELKLFTLKPSLSDSWGEYLRTFAVDRDDPFESIAFSPDSRLLACANSKSVNIYNASSGICLQTIRHPFFSTNVAFSCESLLATSDDSLVRIWGPATGICMKTLEGHENDITYLAFSGSYLASASQDMTVKIWDYVDGTCFRTLVGHTGAVYTVAFSSHSLVAASGIQSIKIWNVNSGACLHTLDKDKFTVSLAFSPDSTQLALAHAHSVKIWTMNSGAYLQTFSGHKDTVLSVVYSRDATWLASASADRTVKIWSLTHGTCLRTFADHSSRVVSVALSHDSGLLASASRDGTVKIWDTSNVEAGTQDDEHSKRVSGLAFLRDSTWLASISEDQTVKIWDSNTGKCLQTLKDFEDILTRIWSCNSTALVLWDKRIIEIWDTTSSSALYSLKSRMWRDEWEVGHDCVALSHNLTRLATSSQGVITIYDISGDSISCLQTLRRSESIDTLDISHDMTKLVSASVRSSPTFIAIWNLDRGELLHTHAGMRVSNMAFDAKGSYLNIGHSTVSAYPPYEVVLFSDPKHALYPSAYYSVYEQWIMYGGKKVLWVPETYPRIYHVKAISPCGKKVAVGTMLGKVWIVNFDARRPD